jgi:hypothetical protein
MAYLTKKELGEAVFLAIKAEIEGRGYALWEENFPPDYPISLRAIWNIRKGQFKVSTLNELPGIQVEEFYTLRIRVNHDTQPKIKNAKP